MRRQSTRVDASERAKLGSQELALFRYLAERPPTSLREVADDFGEANGLARTTVHTMLERLRKKHVVSRTKRDGVFLYRLASDQQDLLRGVVESFVEDTLGGSLTPFVAYLTQSKNLKREEFEALAHFVQQMKQDEGKVGL